MGRRRGVEAGRTTTRLAVYFYFGNPHVDDIQCPEKKTTGELLGEGRGSSFSLGKS